jgi:hypothetical protein
VRRDKNDRLNYNPNGKTQQGCFLYAPASSSRQQTIHDCVSGANITAKYGEQIGNGPVMVIITACSISVFHEDNFIVHLNSITDCGFATGVREAARYNKRIDAAISYGS